MKNLCRVLLPLSILMFSACVVVPRQHEDFTNNLVDVQKIIVMPADIRIVERNFKGDEKPIGDLEEEVRDAFKDSYNKSLSNRDYEVVFFDLEAAEALDSEFPFKYEQFKTAYQAQLEQMNKVPGNSKKKALYTNYNVGETMFELTNQFDGDAIMLVSFYGFKKTGGQVAKDMAATVLLAVATGGSTAASSSSGSSFQLGLVDVNTSNILWSSSGLGEGRFQRAINMPLKFFPKKEDDKNKYKFFRAM